MEIGDHITLVYRGTIQGIREGDSITLVQVGTRWHQLNEVAELQVDPA